MSTIDKASVVCALILLVVAIVARRKQGISHREVGYILECVFAGAAIPKGLFLSYCAFRPEALKLISDYQLYMAVGGIAVAYLGVVTIKSALLAKDSSESGGQDTRS